MDNRLGDNARRLADCLYALSGFHVRVLSLRDSDTPYKAEAGGGCGDLCGFCREHCPSFRDRCPAGDAEHLPSVLLTGAAALFRCPLGVTEAVVPVYDGDQPDGVVTLGRGLVDADEAGSFDAVLARFLAEYPDRTGTEIAAELKEALRRTPFLTQERLDSLIGLAGFAGRGIRVPRRTGQYRQSTETLVRDYVEALDPERLPLGTFSVRAAAERLNISYSQLNRVSERLWGMPLKQYVLRIKVEAAGRILAEQPELPVAEAAAMVGIDNPNYFVKLFRKRMGCRAGEYRSQILGKAAERKP